MYVHKPMVKFSGASRKCFFVCKFLKYIHVVPDKTKFLKAFRIHKILFIIQNPKMREMYKATVLIRYFSHYKQVLNAEDAKLIKITC